MTTLIWGLLSYINLVKVDARGDPFVPGDILLLTEGMEAVGNYQLNMHWGKLALLLGLSLALILLGTGSKSARPRLVIRLVAALTVVAAFGTTMAFLYPDSELYDRMEGPNRANVPAVYEAFGFPYCFLHNFNLYPVDKPPGYNAQEAASYEDTYREAEAAPETAPNILMVMCEAFTDLPNQAAFTYTGETNPIAAYNRLAEQTLSGHFGRVQHRRRHGQYGIRRSDRYDDQPHRHRHHLRLSGSPPQHRLHPPHADPGRIPHLFSCIRARIGSTTGKACILIWASRIRYSRMPSAGPTWWEIGFPTQGFSGY